MNSREAAIHGRMKEYFNIILKDPTQLPKFTSSGISYILPKDQNTGDKTNNKQQHGLQSVQTSDISNSEKNSHQRDDRRTQVRKKCKAAKIRALLDSVNSGHVTDKQNKLSMYLK